MRRLRLLSGTKRRWGGPAGVGASLLVCLALSACSTGGAGGGTKRSFRWAPFDPRNFSSPTPARNQWLPLRRGYQWIRIGRTDVGHRAVPHLVATTVTGVTKVVDGVQTAVVMDQDIDAGQIAQQSLDFLAQDRRGNVWSLGGYTEDYEGARFVSTADAWLAGVKGARPGILMPADPRTTLPPWAIAQPPGADPDAAQVVQTGRSQCVPFACFKNVLVVREGKASALDNEFKYYAPGTGQILNAPRSKSLHKDVEKLVNLIQLSPRGLAAATAEALRLDRHARMTSPSVFGRSHVAKVGP